MGQQSVNIAACNAALANTIVTLWELESGRSHENTKTGRMTRLDYT
jgi:hypothetical protein